jgi:hypothetical protein
VLTSVSTPDDPVLAMLARGLAAMLLLAFSTVMTVTNASLNQSTSMLRHGDSNTTSAQATPSAMDVIGRGAAQVTMVGAGDPSRLGMLLAGPTASSWDRGFDPRLLRLLSGEDRASFACTFQTSGQPDAAQRFVLKCREIEQGIEQQRLSMLGFVLGFLCLGILGVAIALFVIAKKRRISARAENERVVAACDTVRLTGETTEDPVPYAKCVQQTCA